MPIKPAFMRISGDNFFKKKLTSRKRSDGKGVVVMAHKISNECIACGACASTCPVEAIVMGDDKYVIDVEACIDCGACEGGCPVDAIAAE